MTRTEALRWWRAGYETGPRAAGHEQQAAARRDQTAASRQAEIDAVLLDIIDALASLFTSHDGSRD